jgi:hypothetical protein
MSAARPDTWMPLYVADYLADTGHLSTRQHGAYLLLIMHYWRTGKPLPTRVEHLFRICRLTKPTNGPRTAKRSSRSSTLTPDGYTHAASRRNCNRRKSLSRKRPSPVRPAHKHGRNVSPTHRQHLFQHLLQQPTQQTVN